MKKLAIYLSMMLSLLIVCFTLFSKNVKAETSKKVDVITDVKIQNNDGGDLTTPLGRYDTFRLNAKFALEGKNVKAGDTTEVTISSPIDIKSQDFEIKDSITGKLIANAKVDATTGKIVLTFTKFVEEKNDISGSFFFYAGVNKDKFPNDGNAPVKVSVNNKVKFDGTVKSGTIGEGKRYTIIKSGWDNGNHKSLGFRISVNRTNEAISNAVLSDTMESPGVTYKPGSFKIYKGTWDHSSGTWQLLNKTDVTSQYTVNATDTTFTINLGNISANDHFAVEYEAVVNYDAVDREVIKNKATIVGDNKKPYDSNSKVNIQIAGGEGVGYAFGIQVHKVDESNEPLKGAKFQVIRQATGQVLGEFESDAKGEFSLKELLRDKYIIKEIQAPEGYELAEDTIVEASEFTTPTKPVSKTIVNKKEKPAKTQAVIELDKVLTGRDLVDGEFSFELYEGSNKLQTTTNQNGKITFAPIEYTEEGEHTYTVKEVKGDNATITYDASEKQVTVKVTRDGGALKAEVVYPESKTFTNAFTPNATTATIELTKELTGRDLVDGEFSFELYEGANKLQTVTNKAGKVTFESISYTEEGEHTYTVKEVKGDNATIAYDASEKQVTVKVTRDGDSLKAEVVYPESKTFTNAFTPNAATATIELTKELTGRDLVDGEFSFELYEGTNKLQTVTNKSGKVSFDAISYTAEGEHTYTVKEVKGDNATITYDASEKQVTVKVTRDGDSLKAEVVYPESKTFTNAFTPNATTATIELAKELTGRDLVDGEFSFELYEGANKLQTVTNKSGKVTFDAISYTAEGEHTYTVKEVKGDNATIAYDASEKQVTVKVTRDGDSLKAEVVYPESKTFTNAFTPNAATATIELTKELTGRDLVDGEFSFELYEGTNKLQTVTNKSGKVSFDAISYTAEGEHTYTVKEVKGDNATITYDASEKQVTVKVTRDGDSLKAEVVYPESKTFTNAFTPNATTATIELAKELTGRDLVDGEFSFELYEGANKLQTVTNKSGKVTFDAISYTAEGEHTYTVKEVKGDNATIAYDTSEKQVTVKVTRDGDSLKAEVVYPESKTFTNAFTPNAATATIELTKELTGRDLVDGEFSFELYEGTNKLQTVTNKAGKVTFESISYTAEGEHTYTVKEVKGTTPGITYDTAEKQVTVKVTKDGDNLKATVVYPESKAFANTYSAPSPAKAQISASKILEGRDLKDGEFSFSLLDEAGEVLQTKQNAADGSVAFDEISYSQEDAGKTFHYTIKEVIPQSQEKGMTYDQASIEVTVTVTKDDASNTIKATVAYGEKKSFINTFVTSEIPPTPPVVEKPEAKLYTIQLHKVNGEGQALSGAVFGLFEADGVTAVANPYGEGQATATSDANGLVSFVGFEAKDYVVKELTAPEGYQLSTASIAVSATELSAATDLVVDKGNVVNQPFTAIPPTPPVVEKPELTLYSIQLHKVNNEGQVLAGAVFGLFEADGVTPVANPYGEGQATATSDANGLVTFTGLVAKDYVVKELTAPEGYQLSEEAITVSSSQLIASTDQVLDQGKVVNKPFTAIPPTPPVVEKPELKLYTIQLHKVNPFYQSLAGAVFGLFEADGVTPVANPYGEGQATATSDANGLVSFVGFEAKDYVVKELTAPAGYQLSTVSITVSAAELTAATNLVVDKGNVVNQLTPPKGDTPPPSTDKPRKEIPSNPPKGNTPPPSTEKPEKEIPSNPPKEDKKEVLPSTGQSMSEGLVATGLALAVAGSALVYKKREN